MPIEEVAAIKTFFYKASPDCHRPFFLLRYLLKGETKQRGLEITSLLRWMWGEVDMKKKSAASLCAQGQSFPNSQWRDCQLETCQHWGIHDPKQEKLYRSKPALLIVWGVSLRAVFCKTKQCNNSIFHCWKFLGRFWGTLLRRAQHGGDLPLTLVFTATEVQMQLEIETESWWPIDWDPLILFTHSHRKLNHLPSVFSLISLGLQG